MKKQIRTTPYKFCGFHLRESNSESESRTVAGHAVVFGVRSLNLIPWSDKREIYEIMEPGCITSELINRSDVVLTAFHDNTKILGRSVNGKGTLKLTIDKRGLLQCCEWPNTTLADELLELIRRGDIAGMSFAYSTNEEDNNHVSYEKLPHRSRDGKEVWIRHVKRVTGLYDVTVAGHPAYPSTDIGTRDIEIFLNNKVSGNVDKTAESMRRTLELRERRRRLERLAMYAMYANYFEF